MWNLEILTKLREANSFLLDPLRCVKVFWNCPNTPQYQYDLAMALYNVGRHLTIRRGDEQAGAEYYQTSFVLLKKLREEGALEDRPEGVQILEILSLVFD